MYGHGFPAPEAIQKERTVLFEPIKVVGNGYEEVLKQKGENYHYEGKKLAKGTYFVLAKYKPTAWIEKEDGKWEMNKTRKRHFRGSEVLRHLNYGCQVYYGGGR